MAGRICQQTLTLQPVRGLDAPVSAFSDRLLGQQFAFRGFSMLSIRKTSIAAVAAGSLLIGVNPASALTTSPNQNPILNPGQVLPLTPATNALNAKGFNQANFPGIWAGAPLGTTPQLQDVRLFTRGRLAGSFTVENYSPAAIPVNSPALSFNLNANALNTQTLTTTNTTGNVAAATTTTTTTNDFTNPPGTPPGPPPTTPCAAGWQAGNYFNAPPFIVNTQVWNCSTTTTTPGLQTFTINPSSAFSSANWSLIGSGNTNGIASSFWSGNTVSIPSFVSLSFFSLAPIARNATFTLDGSFGNNYLQYTYNYINNQVPTPLPVVGAGLAFSFSRRLRRRIKSSATLAS